MEAETPEPTTPGTPQLLFNLYDVGEVEIADPAMQRYVNLHSMIVPHSCGKLNGGEFGKSHMLIVERLINRLMQSEQNTGKKHLAIRIVKDAFAIVEKRTKRNPVQVLVEAVTNAGPREETVRLKYGGINVPKSVDTAPQRRVDSGAQVHHRGRPEELARQEVGRRGPRGRADRSLEGRHQGLLGRKEGRARADCEVRPLDTPPFF